MLRLRCFSDRNAEERVCSIPHEIGTVTGCPWCRRPLVAEFETPPHDNRDAAKLSLSQIGDDFELEKYVQDRIRLALGEANKQAKTLNVESTSDAQMSLPAGNLAPPRFAHVSVLYGTKYDYFLGALMLGYRLLESNHDTTLLVTYDVPSRFVEVLLLFWNRIVYVTYMSLGKDVSSSMFQNPQWTRFREVFTKLQVLDLVQYEKVLFLDLDILVRNVAALDALFWDVEAPAACKRGDFPPDATGSLKRDTGSVLDYRTFWVGYERRRWSPDWEEWLPSWQQASGINAGVMLLRPNLATMALIRRECKAWDHPEHYPTYMPEQEYLGRLLSVVDTDTLEQTRRCTTEQRFVDGMRNQVREASKTSNLAAGIHSILASMQSSTQPNASVGYIDGQPPQGAIVTTTVQLNDIAMAHSIKELPRGWRHLGPGYNFEIDKNRRIPFDFSEEHKRLAEAWDEIHVFHYSGHLCKPWGFLYRSRGELEKESASSEGTPAKLARTGDDAESVSSLFRSKQEVYDAVNEDADPRIVASIREWLDAFFELEEVFAFLRSPSFFDPTIAEPKKQNQ